MQQALMNPAESRRCAGAPPALDAILRVTTAQWAQALRAEGAVARAAVIESLATRIGVARRGRPLPPAFAPSLSSSSSFRKPRP